MSMLKLCRCGKMISANLKHCDQCAANHDKERHKLYDKYRRDKKSAAFYNSQPWKSTSANVRVRDHHMCQLCLINKQFKTVDVVHHIKELRNYPRLALVKSNLISLCAGCHRHVHVEYDKGNKQRKVMEERLFEIVSKSHTI